MAKYSKEIKSAYIEHRESSGAEETRYTADELMEMMSNPETGDDEEDREDEEVQTCFFNPYNTDVRFKDGLMTDIWQYNYPEGPEE